MKVTMYVYKYISYESGHVDKYISYESDHVD